MEQLGNAETESRGSGGRISVAPRRKWALTQEAFDKLLALLGPDPESAGHKYLELRANLTRFFEWRGSQFPEDHADETINRMAKRAAEGEEIRNPSGYVLGVARMLLLETYKERAKESRALGELAVSENSPSYVEELEPRAECLRRCLKALPAESRELILQYYEGERESKIEHRRKLSELYNVSLNTLRTRALRLREKLQSCVAACLKKQ